MLWIPLSNLAQIWPFEIKLEVELEAITNHFSTYSDYFIWVCFIIEPDIVMAIFIWINLLFHRWVFLAWKLSIPSNCFRLENAQYRGGSTSSPPDDLDDAFMGGNGGIDVKPNINNINMNNNNINMNNMNMNNNNNNNNNKNKNTNNNNIDNISSINNLVLTKLYYVCFWYQQQE